MANAAVSSLLENVLQLLNSKADLIAGADNELCQLKNDLGLFISFLKVVARKPKKDDKLSREMERQIKEVVYDAEDTIDSCLTLAAKGNKSLRRGRDLSLARELRSLREDKLHPMFDRARMVFADLQIDDESSTGTSLGEQWTERKKVPLIMQDDIVGLELDEMMIIYRLSETTKELDVVSIIGTLGLGKTTLALKIYNNLTIQYEFPTRIWVDVSQVFNRKDVFLKILEQFTSVDMSSLSDQDLVEIARGYLGPVKFLLVMDDVWSVDAWNAIEVVLPKSNGMAKVLITSRNKEVAMHANPTRPPHRMGLLSHKESWDLLRLEVLRNLDDFPPQLRALGKQLAGRCNGLPLAIRLIGGILAEKFSRREDSSATVNEWMMVYQNVNLMSTAERPAILDIVKLSYERLPNDLRDCFLYLGVFPQEFEILTSTLSSLWIAEGFIQHKEGQSLEETAEENFKDLIRRNLVKVDKINRYGEVKTCRVGAEIHAFCCSKAAEYNLFKEIKMLEEGVFDPPISEMQKCRRVCIHSHLSKLISENLYGPGIRSFLCYGKEIFVLHPEFVSAIPNAFKLLRVFEAKSMNFTRFPMKFAKLIHLRYISLSCDDLDVLPETISELWNLQTLIVHTELPSLEVRANIWRMIQLRHLKTKAIIFLTIQGEGEGEGNAAQNLQTLSKLSSQYCTEDIINRARNLKSLGIHGKLTNLLNIIKSLGKLDCLEKLKLVNDLVYESVSRSQLHGLPPPNCFPPNLKRLTLSATFMDWEHMSTLGQIDTLEVLKLKNNAFTGLSWHVDGHGFRCLQVLVIANTDLVLWEASTDSFSSLRHLLLENCEKLRQIPVGLAKSLKKLDLEGPNETLVDSARKIGEVKEREGGRCRWGGPLHWHWT